MRAARWTNLWGALLVLGLTGCDGDDSPVEPVTSGGPMTAPRGNPAAPPRPTLLPTIGTTTGTTLGASATAVKAPSGTTAIAVSDSRIDVSWQDNSTNETGFEVHRSTNGPGGAFALRAVLGADVTSYQESGLTPSTQYCYSVRTFRKVGSKTAYSTFSTAACATTLPPPIPPAPSGADATPTGSTEITVQWTDNSTNEAGFRVERSTDGGANWASAGTTSAGIGALRDLGRTNEQQVCYRVIAFNNAGDSPPSNTDCTVPPAAPTDLTATFIGATTEVDLRWTDNSAVEDGYDVVISDAFGSFVRSVSLPANTTSYRTSFAAYYLVHATRDGGSSDPSNIASAECVGPDCPVLCSGNFDCPGGFVCNGTVCVAHCGDGVKNGDESDVDCGGLYCGGCAAGQTCWVDADCVSGICAAPGICQS